MSVFGKGARQSTVVFLTKSNMAGMYEERRIIERIKECNALGLAATYVIRTEYEGIPKLGKEKRDRQNDEIA